jgi:hypothetical protein
VVKVTGPAYSGCGQQLFGVDFSSAPSRRKPIVAAFGVAAGDRVYPTRLEALLDLPAYAELITRPGPWLGAFDLPFGLPRELVEQLGWPTRWPALIAGFAALPRPAIRDRFAAFCAARPAGSKFAHRACDRLAGSSPSMKWVNPPVAWMLHAGVPPLIRAGVHVPGLHDDGDPSRVAVEAYPGLLARVAIGRRSYKSDDLHRQTTARRDARADLVDALIAGLPGLGLRLAVEPALRKLLIDDARADALDAVLCLMQAAFASRRADFGLPRRVDPVEGWIVGAGLIGRAATADPARRGRPEAADAGSGNAQSGVAPR